MEIYKEFGFESAHRLPNVPADHKCSRLHGHSYRVSVHVEGPARRRPGWVCDFAEISEACTPVRAELDHRYLNEIRGLENPTSEVLARWIWDPPCRRASRPVRWWRSARPALPVVATGEGEPAPGSPVVVQAGPALKRVLVAAASLR